MLTLYSKGMRYETDKFCYLHRYFDAFGKIIIGGTIIAQRGKNQAISAHIQYLVEWSDKNIVKLTTNCTDDTDFFCEIRVICGSFNTLSTKARYTFCKISLNNQHRIAEGEEAIPFGHSRLIGGAD